MSSSINASFLLLPDDENYLSQILNFIEEQARRKFKENLRKSYQPKQNDEENPEEIEDALNRIFTFNMPELKGDVPAINEPFDFGVAPNDPRFYNKNPSNQQMEEEEDVVRYSNSMDGLEKDSNEGPYMRIKGPLIVNPKPNPDSFHKSKDMQGLLHKWGRNNNNNAVPGGFDSRLPPGAPSLMHGQEVVQRPVPVTEQAPVSIYAVALIAGVSAAITIGLIALGVGWWTWVDHLTRTIGPRTDKIILELRISRNQPVFSTTKPRNTFNTTEYFAICNANERVRTVTSQFLSKIETRI